MKLAFLGNCQLANVGNLFARMAGAKFINAEIVWTKPVFELKNDDYLPLFHALDRADAIYIQYHDTYHGMYATNHLSKYFDLRIVPTLESFVSAPQMASWSDRTPIPYHLDFVDFRILEMHLQKTGAHRAAEIYADVELNGEIVQALIAQSIYKYNDKFERGLVRFNYAPEYRAAMQTDLESYFTVNHPSNRHLEWLTNQILADAGFQQKLTLKGMPELLGQFVSPSLRNDSRQGRYIINAVSMNLLTAIKMYYAYFDTLDPKFLEGEYHRSVYHAIRGGGPQQQFAVMAQNLFAVTARDHSTDPGQDVSDNLVITA